MAALHAKAVDFVKTGEEVSVPKHLLAKEWPDYMEKDKLLSFEGPTVIGEMYREIKKIIEETRGKE